MMLQQVCNYAISIHHCISEHFQTVFLLSILYPQGPGKSPTIWEFNQCGFQEQEDHQSRKWRSPPICELAATFHRLIRHQALCQRCNTHSLFLKREEGVKAELHTQTAATGSCFNTSHPSWPAPAKVHQLGQQVIKALVCAFLYTKVLQKKKEKTHRKMKLKDNMTFHELLRIVLL